MIAPHGGKLIDRTLSEGEKNKAKEQAKTLPSIQLTADLVSDVENIAFGVFSPLKGFLGEEDYRSILNHMRLANDLPWTIPIVLDVSRDEARSLKEGQEVALLNPRG